MFSQTLWLQYFSFRKCKSLPNQCIGLSVGIWVSDSIDNSFRHVHHLTEKEEVSGNLIRQTDSKHHAAASD